MIAIEWQMNQLGVRFRHIGVQLTTRRRQAVYFLEQIRLINRPQSANQKTYLSLRLSCAIQQASKA